MTEVTVDRGTHLPDLAAHVWTWEIPLYLFFAGLAAGVMILASTLWARKPAAERSAWLRRMPFAAPICLGLGMAVLFPHLSLKSHAFRFFTTFELLAPMSWEAWLLLLAAPASALLALGGLTRPEAEALASWRPVAALRLGGLALWARDLSERWPRGLRRLNLGLGLALGAYPGFLLGTMVARPVWNSALLIPLFLVSALLTGAALTRMFPIGAEESATLRRVSVAAIALMGAMLAVFLLWLVGGGAASRQAAALFLGGPFTASFWVVVMIAGLGAPLLLELAEGTRRLRPSLASPVLLLVGGLGLRLVLVAAGQ